MHTPNKKLARAVQQYGYTYDYSRQAEPRKIGPIPELLQKLCRRVEQVLTHLSVETPAFDQIIVNEYLPGQGIAPHIDHSKQFGKVIASISMGSPCIMDFSPRDAPTTKENIWSQVLERRSLVILTGEARYRWTHAIAKRKQDDWAGVRKERRVTENQKVRQFIRHRRVSITMRKVVASVTTAIPQAGNQDVESIQI